MIQRLFFWKQPAMSSSSVFPHNSNNSSSINKAAAALPEGYGAPISVVNQRKGDPIDPTLDSCCQRELEGNRQWNAIQVALKRHDRIARMERMRRNAVTLEGGVLACRCNFDPQSDGGDYEALRHLRLLVSDNNNDNAASSITDNNNRQEEDEEEEDNSSSDSDFDYLLDELPVDKDFEEQQREELEEAIVTRDLLLQHGYGTMRQMHPLRVLRTAGLLHTNEGAVVLHLFDPTSDMSASLDMVLEKHAIHYKGTKFLRSDGRAVLKMNPSFCPVTEEDIPALIAIRDGCVVATCANLKGLGYAKVDENQTIYWLDRTNVLIRDPPPEHMLCRISPDVDALLASGILKQKQQGEVDYFNCGVPGCQKTFYHEHVGIATDEQDGLIVKQDGTVKDI